MTLTATAVHETLDERGLLDDAHGPGTYALRVTTPATADAVADAFREVSEVVPNDATLDRLTADRVAYVGASANVYSRLTEHASGDVRRATFLEAFEAVDVVDVWANPSPFESEFNRARTLSEKGWTVWTDGEVL